MKPVHIVVAVLTTGIACLVACGAPSSTGDTEADAGEPNLGHCGVYTGDDCDDCLHAECCSEIAVCGAVPTCITCAHIDPYGPKCEPVGTFAIPLADCTRARCYLPCWGTWPPYRDGGVEGGEDAGTDGSVDGG